MVPEARLLAFIGALFGACGVVFSAVAAHAGGGTIGTGANFLLFHAAVLLAIGLASGFRWLTRAGWLLALGVALFSADLIVRHYGMARLFPMAAPIGGGLMILGWAAVGIAALCWRKAPSRIA